MINFAFLDFVKSWLSDGLEKVGGAIIQGIRYLMFSLSTFIYQLLMNLYDMFSALCTVRLLSNDILQELAKRVGYILGVIMLFYVILGFIQLLLNPDAINDGEKGAVSIIKKTIIVIIMLGSANFAFELLYQIQVTVVSSNIISKLLLPYSVTTVINSKNSTSNNNSSMIDNEQFGSLLAEELFSSFYTIEEFDESDIVSNSDTSSYNDCQTVVNNFRNQLINERSFDLGYTCLNSTIVVNFKIDETTKSEDQETNVVDFNWLLCPIVGLAAVYLMVMYCFKVGVRMVQLMFLEIISPMAIVSYLAPKKDTMFSKWKNIYISTYVDVFIRIAIINFAFFLVATVFSVTGGDGLEFQGTDFSSNPFFKVIMILSILTFAKKAPELLGELLPKSASKLGFGASMKDIVGLGATVGGIAGLGISAIGRVPGAFGKVAQSAAIGYNNFKNARGFGKLGAAAGGVFRTAGSALGGVMSVGTGAVSGAARGMQAGHGAKGQMLSAARAGQQAAAKANTERAQRIASGSTRGERVGDAVRGFFGVESGSSRDDREISALSEYSKIQSEIEGYADNNSSIKRLKRDYEAIQAAGRNEGESDADYTKRIERARKAYTEAKSGFVNNVLAGHIGNGNFEVEYNVDGTTYTTDYVMDVTKDSNTIQSIQAAQEKANKMVTGNKKLFAGYSNIVNKDTMEQNTYRANKDIAVRQSTKRVGNK